MYHVVVCCWLQWHLNPQTVYTDTSEDSPYIGLYVIPYGSKYTTYKNASHDYMLIFEF